MNAIENFAALSEQEQRVFAEALIQKINAEHAFSDHTEFKIIDISVDEYYDGCLRIDATPTELLEVTRKAHWQASDDEDAYSAPYEYSTDDIDYDTDLNIFDEFAYILKTDSTRVDGYTVYAEIADADMEEISEVEVDNIEDDDSGIGSYEYFGFTGYDSNPYVEVDGTITSTYSIIVTFSVDPIE
jgi:hypothetical protein